MTVREALVFFQIYFQFFSQTPQSLCQSFEEKYEEAYTLASDMMNDFYIMFEQCVKSSMPSQKFITDNIHNFVNYPAKTTVGFAPKFTSNRKFFANLISTNAFKDMLASDEDELWKHLIKKLKYCDEVVMDQNTLQDFYDREVDQSKI